MPSAKPRIRRRERPKELQLPAYAPWRKLVSGGGATLLVVGPLVGGVLTVAEAQMDAVTALSGSGPDFTIAASPTSLTINKGSSDTSALTLTPLGQFNQTIKLTCSGAPANTTCTIAPTSVTLDGTNNATATLTIQTTSSTASGTYTITAKGAAVPLQHPVSITLTVP